MFVGLLDPHWAEQQNKTFDEKKQQDEIFAVGMYACIYVRTMYKLEYYKLK